MKRPLAIMEEVEGGGRVKQNRLIKNRNCKSLPARQVQCKILLTYP